MLVLHFALLTILATGSLAVLDGKPATPHRFPHHVGLYWKYSGEPPSKLRFYCGGAVVSDSWVLTAAQCVRRLGEVVVKAGKHIVNREEVSEQTRSVVRHVIHPEYEPPIICKRLFAPNDLALLQVDSPFVFNENVSAAEVPNASAYFEYGDLAGWGVISMESDVPSFPDELHYDYALRIIDSQDCANAINETTFDSVLLPVAIDKNHICTRKEDGRACYKHDGSALVGEENDREAIIGIVSESIVPCGFVELPTVYTRVSAYFEWINQTMKSL